MNHHMDKATEERLRAEAWVGDAILALYVREWILVNYTLTQSETGANLSLKTKVDDGEEVPSVTEIFQSANWHERETWDLMGIKFSGHPDLRRILMWEGYPYFPLRKDFPVQGVPTELPGVAFTEAAPTQGAPFATEQGRCPSACREPRSHKF